MSDFKKIGVTIGALVGKKSLKICSAESCNNKHYSKGYCERHYRQIKKHNKIQEIKRHEFCIVVGCGRGHHGKGYCFKHYNQFRTHGKILPRTHLTPNEITIKKDHAEIALYDIYNDERARAWIDLEDVERCQRYKWHLHNGGYAVTERTKMLLHTYIMQFIGIDHINHDKLDNRKINLRRATQQENMRNRLSYTNKSSKYKGVYWNSRDKKWQAYITISKVNKNLGSFEFEVTAAQAYNFVAKEAFGEFACLNSV